MATWIFQGNPKIYDIADAVLKLREDTWLVQQHREDIRPADRVYLWQSGADAGIVAIAEVLDEVSDRTLPDEGMPFVRDSIKLGGVQPRVRIRITRVIEPKLRRSDMKAHPGLDKLSILRFAEGTNFPVTPDEARIIDELLGA